jgi:glycosyltransferase involved in cell wall biosynthesis
MPHDETLLSIVIPAYNYASTLKRAVNSVAEQLNQNHELIVIDDGSTDDTPLVLEKLQQQIRGNVGFIRKKNGGASTARNRGILEARGSFLVFLDADDELLPGALAIIEEHIASHPGTCLVIGGHISVLTSGKQRKHIPGELPASPFERVHNYLLRKTIVLSNGACAMHRSIFDRGLYPESFRSAEDIPVFAQALANYPCSVLKLPLALIYKHEDSLRHQFSHAKAGGIRLVDEVFSGSRLGREFQSLTKPFFSQRCLSLFRSAYLANDDVSAKEFFTLAVKNDWRVLFNASYVKKAARLWAKKILGTIPNQR